MLVHPQFDPIAVQAGPLAVHWYGLMYRPSYHKRKEEKNEQEKRIHSGI